MVYHDVNNVNANNISFSTDKYPLEFSAVEILRKGFHQDSYFNRLYT